MTYDALLFYFGRIPIRTYIYYLDGSFSCFYQPVVNSEVKTFWHEKLARNVTIDENIFSFVHKTWQ